MSEEKRLKSGWQMVKFGDVVRQVKDKVDPKKSGLERYIAGEHMNTDDLKIRCWGTICDDYLGPAFQMRFKPGQVLYGSRRTYLRKVATPDFEGICANTTFVLESKDSNVLLPEFLPFVMQTETFHRHSIDQSKGSVNPYVNFSDLAWYEFALPPMEEQKQLFTLLSKIEKVIESTAKLNNHIDNLKSSKSKSIFGDFIFDNTIPKRQLADLLSEPICNGIFVKKELFGKGIPLINVTDVYKGFSVDISKLDKVPATQKEACKFSAKTSDVIYNRSSLVREGIGQACLVPEHDKIVVFECHLMRARPNKNKILGSFLTRYSLCPFGRQHFLSYAQTTTMTTINQSDLAKLLVPCPDIKSQSYISDFFEKIEEKQMNIQARLKKQIDLKNQVLERILSAKAI